MSFKDSRRLETTIVSIREEARELSIATQSKLAQLMTILASGYLEAMCRELLLDYVKQHADEKVYRFADRSLKRFTNPNMERIIRLVESFDKDSARELTEFTREGDGVRIRESVNGIVAQRNIIAHGRLSNTTIANIDQQFQDAKRLTDKLRRLFQ